MNDDKRSQRRNFLKQLTILGTAASVSTTLQSSVPGSMHFTGMAGNFQKEATGPTILFQGDSITDGNRTRNNDWNHIMGHGYQYIIASKLWYEFPGKNFHFINRGISGNKVTDLAARWQQDTLDLTPALLSILIGINDISASISGDKNFTAAQYEEGYRSLLLQTKRSLPKIRLVLCEPFILPVGKVKENWEIYSVETEVRRKIVQELSVAFDAVFIEFQQAFNDALSKAPAEYWIWDGIHPMPAGHELMAREWMKQVGKKTSLFSE